MLLGMPSVLAVLAAVLALLDVVLLAVAGVLEAGALEALDALEAPEASEVQTPQHGHWREALPRLDMSGMPPQSGSEQETASMVQPCQGTCTHGTGCEVRVTLGFLVEGAEVAREAGGREARELTLSSISPSFLEPASRRFFNAAPSFVPFTVIAL